MTLIDVSQKLLVQDRRSDLGGTHAPPKKCPHMATESELPPSLSWHHGTPTTANPFVQVQLPPGFEHESRKSRAVSYKTQDFARGTSRTYEQAKACVLSWAWQWWASLSDSQKSAVQHGSSRVGDSTTSAKRRKVQG